MTVKTQWAQLAAVRGAINQVLLVFLINVPTVSFGLALGWVSLVSGETAAGEGGGAGGKGGDEAGRAAVIASVTTFTASLVGVPLSARALLAGRKVALIATSACFVVCWSLKLASVWGGAVWGGAWLVLAARAAAGLGGAAAWALAPLLAGEMCSPRFRGAAVAALALAHNCGALLMYLAADAAAPQRTILWWCLGLSVTHCVVFSFLPESPSFLAAKGRVKEASAALAWLRGLSVADPALEAELRALPPIERAQSSWSLTREMLSDPQRRRAFIIGALAVIGQEACGVLAILQYAERVFVLARDEEAHVTSQLSPALNVTSQLSPTLNVTSQLSPALNVTSQLSPALNVTSQLLPALDVTSPLSPARQAVIVGAVQLVASALALYLVERVGRRPLLVWSAGAAGGALALAAALAGRSARGAAAALALAVAADSAGLQPAPYALLADMFHYQFRGCALLLASAGASAGNALEVALFPLAARAGLRAALALAAALTLAYALFAALLVPETRGRQPEQIYAEVGPAPPGAGGRTECTGVTMGLLDKLSAWFSGGEQATVLVLGLDGSGKTSTLNAMRPPEQRVTHTVPTVGHQKDYFQSGGVSFSAWDVSGAARMRPLWERHYRDAHAVIFVVDSADHLRLVVAREELELLLAHPDMFGRRISPFFRTLGLERIGDKPWHVCSSSALSGAGLADAVAWLARQLRERRAR
ncbi:solute carrier family 2, facilitated glucose transporter member 6-like [Melitaea cinxia]|uniref:solute carrier family 2, facilitated glucose transporter member 6-like n=1 Tax=Melitaea cinxia TaxID=113334 RepID=UPI001E271A3D|nr:solute carrier family 2, facilitated glucose transporter member 6-like [Melitaea cinxia]